MEDKVLESFLDDFSQRMGIGQHPEPDRFEAFAAASVVEKYHHVNIGTDVLDDILAGGGQDAGIDAVAILINGQMVGTKADVERMAGNNEIRRDTTVSFIFVQAKTSPRFESRYIHTFGSGVNAFLKAALTGEIPEGRFSVRMTERIQAAAAVFDNAAKMAKNPKPALYYVTAGQWTDAVEPSGAISDWGTAIDQLKCLSEKVRVTPIGASDLIKIARDIKHGIEKQVHFSERTTFPIIDDNVREAYIGLLSGDQFIDLISTDEGELNRNIFYENVRDFQGLDNPVNRAINDTLGSELTKNNFPLLNNGVTIVAKGIRATGNRLTISNFQIVNGCQTAHVCFLNKDKIDNGIFVPVKLISTDDNNIINDIIKATNNQTMIGPHNLAAQEDFHKRLEDFYNAKESNRSDRIYYERRSGQYRMDENIHHKDIITFSIQTRAFVGMFLDAPHDCGRQSGHLLSYYGDSLFAENHFPDSYYASGVTYTAVYEWLGANSRAHNRLGYYKYFIMFILRHLIADTNMPRFNARSMPGYAAGIVEALRDTTFARAKISEAVRILEHCRSNFAANNPEVSAFPSEHGKLTNEVKIFLRSGESLPALLDTIPDPIVGSTEEGVILSFGRNGNRYGHIARDIGGNNIFFHENNIKYIPSDRLRERTRVRYRVSFDHRGRFQAVDVEYIP